MPVRAMGKAMKGRPKAGGKAGKAGRRKATTPKRSIPHKPTATGQETDVARLTRERDEALEREKGAAEVLRVISSSPWDPKPVFDAVLESATRICGAKFGLLYRFDGNAFHLAAEAGTPPEFSKWLRQNELSKRAALAAGSESFAGGNQQPLRDQGRASGCPHFFLRWLGQL